MIKKALEKGLDTSPEARMQRAVDQGYLTNARLQDLLERNIDSSAYRNVSIHEPFNTKQEATNAIKAIYDPLRMNFLGNKANVYKEELQRLIPENFDRYAFSNYISDPNLENLNDLPEYLKGLASDKDRIANLQSAYYDWLDSPATLLHGGLGDIDSFSPKYLGSSTQASSSKHGTFTTNNPADAQFYSEGAAMNPFGAKAARKNKMLLDLEYDKMGIAPEERIRIQRNIDRLNSIDIPENFETTYPLHIRTLNPKIIDNKGTGYGEITRNLYDARDAGHDAAIFHNIVDPSPSSTHIVSFDPANIRSINALFDPENTKSRNLLASTLLPTSGIGISMLNNYDNVEDSESPKFAAGGLVDDETIDSAKAFGRGAWHGGTMAFDEPIQAALGAFIAKQMRPELFEDSTWNELRHEAIYDQAKRRREIEEESPNSYLAGELASGLLPMAMGNNLKQQILASALMSGTMAFNEAPTLEDALVAAPEGAAFGAAIPPVLVGAGKVAKPVVRSAGKLFSPLANAAERELDKLRLMVPQ